MLDFDCVSKCFETAKGNKAINYSQKYHKFLGFNLINIHINPVRSPSKRRKRGLVYLKVSLLLDDWKEFEY